MVQTRCNVGGLNIRLHGYKAEPCVKRRIPIEVAEGRERYALHAPVPGRLYEGVDQRGADSPAAEIRMNRYFLQMQPGVDFQAGREGDDFVVRLGNDQ